MYVMSTFSICRKCETRQKLNLSDRSQNSANLWGGDKDKVCKGGLWGSGNVLQYLDLRGGYICKNSSDCTFKICVLYYI